LIFLVLLPSSCVTIFLYCNNERKRKGTGERQKEFTKEKVIPFGFQNDDKREDDDAQNIRS
jgi:hypothetical protein